MSDIEIKVCVWGGVSFIECVIIWYLVSFFLFFTLSPLLENDLRENRALFCSLQLSPHQDEQLAHDTCSIKTSWMNAFKVGEVSVCMTPSNQAHRSGATDVNLRNPVSWRHVSSGTDSWLTAWLGAVSPTHSCLPCGTGMRRLTCLPAQGLIRTRQDNECECAPEARPGFPQGRD